MLPALVMRWPLSASAGNRDLYISYVAELGQAGRPVLRVLLSIILLVCIDPSTARADPAASVRVQNLAGQTLDGTLVEISVSQVTIKGEASADWKRTDVLRIDWVAQPESLLENAPQLLLANGDRLGLRPESIDAESLVGKWVRCSIK